MGFFDSSSSSTSNNTQNVDSRQVNTITNTTNADSNKRNFTTASGHGADLRQGERETARAAGDLMACIGDARGACVTR